MKSITRPALMIALTAAITAVPALAASQAPDSDSSAQGQSVISETGSDHQARHYQGNHDSASSSMRKTGIDSPH